MLMPKIFNHRHDIIGQKDYFVYCGPKSKRIFKFGLMIVK